MNVFNEDGSLAMSINIHVKCIVYNEGNGNVLYDFEKYNQVLALVVQKVNVKARDSVKEWLLANSKKIQQLEDNYNKKFGKQKKQSNNDQLSLF